MLILIWTIVSQSKLRELLNVRLPLSEVPLPPLVVRQAGPGAGVEGRLRAVCLLGRTSIDYLQVVNYP